MPEELEARVHVDAMVEYDHAAARVAQRRPREYGEVDALLIHEHALLAVRRIQDVPLAILVNLRRRALADAREGFRQQAGHYGTVRDRHTNGFILTFLSSPRSHGPIIIPGCTDIHLVDGMRELST